MDSSKAIGVPQGASRGDEELALGSYIGKYRVVAELGRGAMANVYLTVAQGPVGVQKLIALKVLRNSVAAEPEMLAMFLDEARLAAQLNHANIVKTYEVGDEGGHHVIVMEYLEGQTLSAVVRKLKTTADTLPLPLFLRVIIRVLDGLHYAHELTAYDGSPLQLVHRDVSPQNVFLTYDGQIKLVDFGIAKAATSENRTATGIIKGKLSYMAPEQMVASGIDRRADIYSVGCMLWAAAAGEKLWKDMAGVEVARKVMSGEIPRPSSVNPACSPELERIVMRALMPEPDQRYSTALEFQEAIERYCEEAGLITKDKEVGAYVSSLFESRRAQLRAAIERELKAAAADPTGGTGSVPKGTQQASAVSGSQSPTMIAHRRPARWMWLALPLLLAAAGLFAQSQMKRSDPTPTAPTHAATPPPPPPPTVVPSTVTLELSAEPPSARLTLDGAPMNGNPVAKVLQKGNVHRVSASADGYASATREFRADENGSVKLLLQRLPPPPSASVAGAKRPPRRAAPPRPTSSPSAPAVAPSDPCAQPFYVNVEGRKAIRPECM
jgi:serine/threonine-protein kinase